MNEFMTADLLSSGIPVVIILLALYIFFKVASFIVKSILAVVCLLMLAYLVMSFMGIDFNIIEEWLHDTTGWH